MFRFGIVFAAFVIFPFPFDVLPGTHAIAAAYAHFWAALMPWLGGRIVGTSDVVTLQLFASGVLAALATISWAIVDREDRAHTWLASVARTVLRFWLASAMLAYGVDKLWNQSPYVLAEGITACSAAVFLFWRGTATIGALAAGVVLANEMADMFRESGSIDMQTTELLIAAIVLFLAEFATRANREASTLSLYGQGARLVVKVLLVAWLVFHHAQPQIEALF